MKIFIYFTVNFSDISLSLSKIAKECVMRIITNKVYFIVSNEDSGPKTPLVWCELPVNFYFKEYNVVGVNDEFNEIYLEFATRKMKLKSNVQFVTSIIFQ